MCTCHLAAKKHSDFLHALGSRTVQIGAHHHIDISTDINEQNVTENLHTESSRLFRMNSHGSLMCEGFFRIDCPQPWCNFLGPTSGYD